MYLFGLFDVIPRYFEMKDLNYNVANCLKIVYQKSVWEEETLQYIYVYI